MGSIITVIQFIMKMINLFETLMASIKTHLYNKAKEQINQSVSGAQTGVLDERLKAAKALEDLYNNRAPKP